MPLFFLVTHVIESIEAASDLNGPRAYLVIGHREDPASGIDRTVRRGR